MRAKQDIARKAATLIPTGASIMVDAGTTTSVFGQALAKLSGIMVVTNSIDIAQIIKDAGADIELILSEIRRFKVDLTFVAPVVLHANDGARLRLQSP